MEVLEPGQDWKIAALRDFFHVHFFIGENMEYNKEYMNMAYDEALKANNIGEIPVGCVLVNNDYVIRTHNLKEINNCVLDHAELLAIREASDKIKNWRLDDFDMYITLEPCPMCASAIKQARIRNVYCGCRTSDEDHELCTRVFSTVDRNNYVNFVTEKDRNRCEKLLKDFFEKRRNM